MQISARNVLEGTVKSVGMGVVNAEVTVEVAPGVEITAMITKKSAQSLGLEEGKEAQVVIKASNVMVSVD